MKEWSIIFYFSSSICVAAAIIFICFGSSEKQPWNNPAPEKESSAEPGSSSPTGANQERESISEDDIAFIYQTH
ncbi:hypothetical protein AVEN_85363-1 [Araneus ventricosus]|uniref:Uncharacterized protein n=1 Tax=Araneus ventricosus TaxID=182803 RepID=A0A4Y2E109_ARAVE|nr:hypothetical protein AVEN_85363-1 [Araneus ventricosus]